MQDGSLFIDWITITQHHQGAVLPILTGGVTVHYSAEGVPVFERNQSTRIQGSHDTSVRVGCDGFRVSLSGNPGRLSRKDNVFNHGLAGTIEACNRVLVELGLPPFTTSGAHRPAGAAREVASTGRGAVVSRLDVTRNYATGSESSARAFIRWLGGRSIARMKRGQAGDESVWWANTRHMLKAYVKHLEMVKHGSAKDDDLVIWLQKQGVVRVELELKKRLLSELGLNDLANLTDEKLAEIYEQQIEPFKRADRSCDDDILEALPRRSRALAAAWLAGHDVRDLIGKTQLYVHAKVLRECGIDILQPRNVERFPVKVRFIDLQPLAVPEWYSLRAA
ncbi:phage/plasmid replication protein [Thiobacillus sp.]|uniref:phage/plasmid replication domain-containing protein n=1 Tax=Thiobacillus sp. TaxID=924 RepID=UPI0025DB05CF|nr:phage/plasmid replication protein [Thiobacillus sp.]